MAATEKTCSECLERFTVPRHSPRTRCDTCTLKRRREQINAACRRHYQKTLAEKRRNERVKSAKRRAAKLREQAERAQQVLPPPRVAVPLGVFMADQLRRIRRSLPPRALPTGQGVEVCR